MEVKIIRVPGRTTTLEVPEGTMIAEVLNRADIAIVPGEAVKLNGAAVSDMGTVVEEGDKIIVAKGAKGN